MAAESTSPSSINPAPHRHAEEATQPEVAEEGLALEGALTLLEAFLTAGRKRRKVWKAAK